MGFPYLEPPTHSFSPPNAADAVQDIYETHHYTPDGASASCAAVTAGGCDINSGGVSRRKF